MQAHGYEPPAASLGRPHSTPQAARKERRGLALGGSSTCSQASTTELYRSIRMAWVCEGMGGRV